MHSRVTNTLLHTSPRHTTAHHATRSSVRPQANPFRHHPPLTLPFWRRRRASGEPRCCRRRDATAQTRERAGASRRLVHSGGERGHQPVPHSHCLHAKQKQQQQWWWWWCERVSEHEIRGKKTAKQEQEQVLCQTSLQVAFCSEGSKLCVGPCNLPTAISSEGTGEEVRKGC